MRSYRVPMVPGPTRVPADVSAAYQAEYGSSDLEEEFFDLYGRVQEQLQQLLMTRSQMAIMTGEGMAALWGALKSTIRPGDRVLSVATGLFGYGIGEMARAVGAHVEVVEFPYDAVADPMKVESAIVRFRPKMVTMVHCETPSGTLNPVGEVGRLVAKHGVPLFYVDAVSSAVGAELRTDEWQIDLCLVGSQKCLSCPSDLAIVAVSPQAWTVIDEVDYQGYDALLPFRKALENRYFPYTPHWHGIAALEIACRRVLAEGLDAVQARHQRAAEVCRQGLVDLGLTLYPQSMEFNSPTVTAARVPAGLGWAEFDRRLRRRGVGVGADYGPLEGRVFRLGHMGTQADDGLVREALSAIGES
ncbi:MAG TPA: aminotransferase class V-fold PLP-dependent enzyme, partial [Chloroflexota bacterium]|nr:aminotransferase class V-fold PLP-dependent enzyme [Chloroflexota bacterium]